MSPETGVAAPNAIGSTLGLLGDEWTLLIVRYAFAGVRRFGGWKERLGISDAVLSARLAALVDAEVLVRVPYRTRPERFEYRLAPAGRQLWPPLLSIWAWEQHHVAGQDERLPAMVHTVCGSAFEPVLRCARCHEATAVDDVRTGFGPSGGFARSVPVGANRRRAGGRAGSGPGMFPETMALIGSRWSSAVLGAAFLGATRFTDFERALGAPPSIVTERLRSFVSLGVLEPSEGAYRLTAKGRAFFPVVATFLAWGERWRPAPDGPAIVASHGACGEPFVPELACSSCTAALTGPTVHADPADLAPAPFAAID